MSFVEIYSQVRATYDSAKKQRDLFLVRYLYRPPSFALATVFIIGGFSANQVTGLNLVILLIGMALIPSGIAYGMLMGAVVYLSVFVLDCADGNVARYHDQRTLYGKLIDGVLDGCGAPIYMAIAVGNVQLDRSMFGPQIDLVCGFVATVSFLILSFFRARLALALSHADRAVGEAQSAQEDRPTLAKGGLWRRVISAMQGLFANLNPLGPPLLIASVVLDLVSLFLLAYALIYLLLSVAEVGFSLYYFRRRLNVRRTYHDEKANASRAPTE